LPLTLEMTFGALPGPCDVTSVRRVQVSVPLLVETIVTPRRRIAKGRDVEAGRSSNRLPGKLIDLPHHRLDLPIHVEHAAVEHSERREDRLHGRRRHADLRRDVAGIFYAGRRPVGKRDIHDMMALARSGCDTCKRHGAQTGQDDRTSFKHQAFSQGSVMCGAKFIR
jgi:hypothetical protein